MSNVVCQCDEFELQGNRVQEIKTMTQDIPVNWHPNPPASEAAIDQLIAYSVMQLPETYLNLLRVSNGGYAELSLSPWTVDFWTAEDVSRLNAECGMAQNAPNFLAFGSNLGEELLAFSRRESAQSAIYMLSWHLPDEAEALKVFESFEELVQAMTAG